MVFYSFSTPASSGVVFLFFLFYSWCKEYIKENVIYILLFSKKKKKNKKNTNHFAATVRVLYLCKVNAAWLELVPVLAHN